MNCYNCGAELGGEDICQNCGANVKIYKKIMMSSNACYNEALQRASVRDLSGAIDSLKRSLRFNKLNIDARNLLGLIYYEMGEVVEALTEWVISKNYQPQDNAASRYLNEIQKNQAKLDSINQTIKKYNQALLYCKQNSRDLAIIQLKKVLSLNPKMVRAHQLLALLYIEEERYDQAKKTLRNAGKIDANNTLTLRYLKEANTGLKQQNPNKKQKPDELISYQSGNDTIIQPKYLKDTSAAGTIINMVIGIAIGVAITCFLIVPGVRTKVQSDARAEVLEANNTISSKNQTISSLEKQVDDLNSQMEAAKNNEQDTSNKIGSYEQLLNAYVAYADGRVEDAGTALEQVDQDNLSDEAKAVYETINTQVNAEYLSTLYTEGYQAYSSRKFEDAIERFSKIVEIDETYEDGNAMYYLAQSYRRNNDMESAAPYYQKIVEQYPGTERAATSQKYLDEQQQ